MPLQFRGTHSKSSKPKGSSLWYSLRLLLMMNKVTWMGQSLNWRDNCYQLLKAPMVSFADAWGTLTMKSLKSADALTTTPKRWNRFNSVSAPHLLQSMKRLTLCMLIRRQVKDITPKCNLSTTSKIPKLTIFKTSSERCQINWTIRIARLLNSKLASNSCSHQLWWQWKSCSKRTPLVISSSRHLEFLQVKTHREECHPLDFNTLVKSRKSLSGTSDLNVKQDAAHCS